MKRILYVMLFVLPLFSCKKFLTEEPKGRLDESYLTTENGMSELAIAMYANAHDLVTPILNMGVGGTDEVTHATGSSAEVMTLYQSEKLITHSTISNAWRDIYLQINDCNFGLSVVDKVNFSNDATKSRITGELSFFRAWLYWMAVEFWGEGAHFTDKPTRGVITEGYQTTPDVFYKLILTDLDAAISKLDPTVKPGRVNKFAAKALKARALMSLAQYSDATISATGVYSNKNAVYTAAKALADEIISSGTYQLLNDYKAIFDIENENNKEVIWALQMTRDPIYRYPSNIMSKEFTANPIYSLREKKSLASGFGLYEHSSWYGRAQGSYMPTYYYVTLFDKDDKRGEGTFETVYRKLWNPVTNTYNDMGKPFKDGVPTDTILYRPLRNVSAAEAAEYKARGIYIDGLNMIYTGAKNAPGGNRSSNQRKYSNTITKFLDRTRTEPKQDNGGTDIILFRLAEQYLIAAECAFYLNGGDAAKTYLDKLRERARKTPNSLVVNAADINVDYLLDERTRELGAELIRWFDLKRTNKWERITNLNPDASFFDPNVHKLKPVPNNELERVTNYPDGFKQNTGYPSL